MQTERIPMPPTELEGLARPKPEENTWKDLWTGTKALFKMLFRLLIKIGIWTWKIFALLLNWIIKWSANQEKNAEKKMKEQEHRMAVLERQQERSKKDYELHH